MAWAPGSGDKGPRWNALHARVRAGVRGQVMRDLYWGVSLALAVIVTVFAGVAVLAWVITW